MVASHSKSHGFPQEAVLALRTYALAVHYSYGQKSKNPKIQKSKIQKFKSLNV
jgi:hypothetical protein